MNVWGALADDVTASHYGTAWRYLTTRRASIDARAASEMRLGITMARLAYRARKRHTVTLVDVPRLTRLAYDRTFRHLLLRDLTAVRAQAAALIAARRLEATDNATKD